MFGATQLVATLGASPIKGTTLERWRRYARAMCGMGLPVLLIQPGTKRPLDMRTDTEKRNDREISHNSGGVHLATTNFRTVDKYIKRALKDPNGRRTKGHPEPIGENAHLNFAVRLAGSGYVVCDADTPEEVAALTSFLEQHYGVGKAPGPTVLTPGSANQAHHGGGHWWFSLPEGMDLDTSMIPSVTKISVEGHEASFSLYSGNAYVLCPPSKRPEGSYQLVAADNPCPPNLLAHLENALTAAQQRKKERDEYLTRSLTGGLSSLDEQVAEWSKNTSWNDILTPAGWVDTGTVDSCGCPIWTAPGSHSSPKSATAHVCECSQPHIDLLNPPLHVWTDNPGIELEQHIRERGTKTVSKLTVWCLLHHDGDMSRALRAAGIEQDIDGIVFDESRINAVQTTTGVSSRDVSAASGVSTDRVEHTTGTEPQGVRAVDVVHSLDAPTSMDIGGHEWTPPREPIDIDEVVTTPGGRDMWDAWGVKAPDSQEHADYLRQKFPPIGTLAAYRDRPKPQFIIEGMLEHQGLTSIVGPSGVGKSAVALDMAAAVCTGRPWQGRKTIKTNVMYIAGEGVTGAIGRLHTWEQAHDCYELENNFFIVEEAVLFGGGADTWAYLAREIKRNNIGLVIFDTLARMSTGLDENSATDMSNAVTIFDRLRRTTGAGVCYVHHTGHDSSRGRGSTALKAALDSEILVTNTMVDGTDFACVEGTYVDVDGIPLPGKPLCVQVTKQKNGPDDAYEYVCLTPKFDSVVITDTAGNIETPAFAQGTHVELGKQQPESLEETATRVTDYVKRYISGEKFPTTTDIARAVYPDAARRGGPVSEWRNVVNLAIDYALAHRWIFKAKAGYSPTPLFE